MGRGKGKRKIDSENGERPKDRLACFSKRRKTLFNHASRLCMETGCRIAIVTFSPHGNPYVYGNPSVDSVVDQYISESSVSMRGDNSFQHEGFLRQIEDEDEEDRAGTFEEDDEDQSEDDPVKEVDKSFKVHDNTMSLEEVELVHEEMPALREKMGKRLDCMSLSSMVSFVNSDNGSGSDSNSVNGFYNLDPSSSSSAVVNKFPVDSQFNAKEPENNNVFNSNLVDFPVDSQFNAKEPKNNDVFNSDLIGFPVDSLSNLEPHNSDLIDFPVDSQCNLEPENNNVFNSDLIDFPIDSQFNLEPENHNVSNSDLTDSLLLPSNEGLNDNDNWVALKALEELVWETDDFGNQFDSLPPLFEEDDE